MQNLGGLEISGAYANNMASLQAHLWLVGI